MTPKQRAIKDKWVAALRSGDYEQGTGCLRDSRDRFCCLGVLCDIASKEGVIPIPTYDGAFMSHRYGRSVILPSMGVLQWVGLDSSSGVFYIEGETLALSCLNDNCQFTFDQIADVIDYQPAGLFA